MNVFLGKQEGEDCGGKCGRCASGLVCLRVTNEVESRGLNPTEWSPWVDIISPSKGPWTPWGGVVTPGPTRCGKCVRKTGKLTSLHYLRK